MTGETSRSLTSMLFFASVLSLALYLPKASAQETATAKVAPGDERLAEIIREVRKNEALYENLETVQRKVEQLRMEENPVKWSITRIEEKLHTVRQGELIYFHDDGVETRISGEKVDFERISAFDGDKTRTVDFGICANIHEGRHESQFVYPPHCWALFDHRVNFPLSVLLQGTEAIHNHPKVHRYEQEKGSIFEFNRFEAEYVGEEEINGLNCVKLLCRRWYYTIRNGKPSESYMWLAPERNYLCVKFQRFPREVKNPAISVVTVESFREIADGVWLPELVRVEDYGYNDLSEGKQTLEWEDTLELVDAKLNPDRPVRFFSEIDVPEDLPVYHIADGRLAGHRFLDRQPTADSDERVAEIIKKIRIEEAKYHNLDVTSEETYRKPNAGIVGTRSMNETVLSKTQERSIQSNGKRWYASDKTSHGVDGGLYQHQQEAAFDGEWARTFSTYSNTTSRQNSESRSANMARENALSVPVHLPHRFCRRFNGDYWTFSELLASPWSSLRNPYPLRVEYLGEEERDGVRCAVLRTVKRSKEGDKILSIILTWLAIDRNYLPFRSEYYVTPADVELPRVIVTTDDWRELAPGVWLPFDVARHSIEDWGQENVWIGRVLIQHSTTLKVSRAAIDPQVEEELFNGPEVPVGTEVSVRSETGLSLGDFKQEFTGRLDIPEEKYAEMLNAANERERANKRGKQAMDSLIGKPAPEIPASKWLNGSPQTWDDLKGKVVVLDFWAVWCGPCRPDLTRLAERYALQDDESKAELAIIGVHAAGSQLADIQKAMKESDMQYPVYLDLPPESGRGRGTLFNSFEVHAVPNTFVVDADGKIAAYGRLEEMLSKAGQLVEDARPRKNSPKKR